jgi:putative transposase
LAPNTYGCGVIIEPKNWDILALSISKERSMFVAGRFIACLGMTHGKHPFSMDGGGTWYPQACQFLNLEHHTHSSYGKSIIELILQYTKYRMECFDDYFQCRKSGCSFRHPENWVRLFRQYITGRR